MTRITCKCGALRDRERDNYCRECRRAYQREWSQKHRAANPQPNRKWMWHTPMSERLAAKSIPEPNSGCWLWTGALCRSGYGHIIESGRASLAHRVSWQTFCGDIPPGLHVLHKCDVRCCVNPSHLFLGTNADNMADKMKKGRQASRLKSRDVISIRSDKRPVPQIAADWGVSESNVYYIKAGVTWRHIESAQA